ncbi:MAG: benzoate-CoA ligase family protein [Alphaproteobacteria bacterium]|nr:benzoate-CoA ligase family protein [Alphaproteobacteria bacterium]
MQKNDITDRVPRDLPISRDIGFELAERYNASEILFDNLAAGRGDKIAIHANTGSATYGELCETACRAGNALKGQGLEPFARILMLLDDTAVYPAAIFGAMRAGFVPVLINTLSPPDLIQYYLEDSGATVAMVESGLASLLTAKTMAGTALETVIVVNGDARPAADIGTVTWADWIAGQSSTLEPADIGRDDMAFWMYSSGSTGRPKGIVHLHHDMAYTNQSYGEEILKLGEDDICYSPPKIFFAYGFGNSITFPFSVGASTVLNTGRPEPTSVFAAIERYQPTILFGLPTLYNALLNDQNNESAGLESVRLCVSAAETLSNELFKAWQARFGLDIIEGLGSTEVLHIYLSNAPSAFKVGAAGRPVQGYEVELRNDRGEPIKPDEPGVLWVRGDSNAPCYWNKPDKTAETMRDGWIYTGDRFETDADGFYYFRGRADDLIKVSGQWVYPLEIELCLADHTAIKECAVLGVELPDKRMSTVAFAVVADGHQAGEALTEELKTYAKQNLLPHKYARTVVYLDALPKTGSGKIDRQKLRDDF